MKNNKKYQKMFKNTVFESDQYCKFAMDTVILDLLS